MGIIVNIINSLLGYNDSKGVVNNPLQRSFDWERRYSGIPMNSGTSDLATIAPGQSLVLFDGTRPLAAPMQASTTLISLNKLDSVNKSIYRLTISGDGEFRASRTTSFNDQTAITVAVNNNAVATFTLDDALNGTFTNVEIGDVMRIKGPNTQDMSDYAFAPPNSGYWVVISKSNDNLSITARRAHNEKFQGMNQSVTLGNTDTANQIIFYSAQGIQVGDTFTLQGTLSSASWNDYDINQVGPNFIDFVSGIPLPQEEDKELISTDDLIFYSNAKKIVYIECDQPCAIRYNQETQDNHIIKPLQVGTDILNGFESKMGFAWKCTVVNKSTINPVKVKWITCE